MTDDLRAALVNGLLAALGERPSPARRRCAAEILRELATREEERADAEERQRRKAPAQCVTARAPRAGRGGRPGSFVRLGHEADRGHLRRRVYVGKVLWYALGSPARLDLQRLDDTLHLVPVTDDLGYAVIVGNGTPRFFAASAQVLDDLANGRYAAEVGPGGSSSVGCWRSARPRRSKERCECECSQLPTDAGRGGACRTPALERGV